MLLNLRRSFVFAVAALVITFVYALLGTGLSQLAFKSQADGSITAKGSTLIGQNWAADPVPGAPPRQLRVPRSSRRHRSLRRLQDPVGW